MFSKIFTRVVSLILAVGILGGCAEIDRRGGFVDQVEDAIFFKADTKTHRLLRSYLLATVLLTAARRDGHNDVDRTAIAGALEGALAVANEAYICLYPPTDPYAAPVEIVDYSQSKYSSDPTFDIKSENFGVPRICQFFDERMARLDYALYRLATVTLFNEGSRQTLGDIRNKLVGKIPVLSDSAVAAIHANKAANQLTTILDDLLNLSFNSFGPVLSLLPLYRDSLELNMWVIADNLRLACSMAGQGAYESVSINNFRNAPESYSLKKPCETFAYELQILQRGNGDLKTWKAFTEHVNAQVSEGNILPIEAFRPHFLLISQLLVRSCKNVLSDGANPKRCDTALDNALELAAFNMNTGTLKDTNQRQFLASLPLPGASFIKIAARRAKPAEPQSTGSIAASPKASVQGSSVVSPSPPIQR